MATPANPLVSVREYSELLKRSDVRYQYWRGEVVAMAGASVRHNLIVANLMGLLWNALRGSDCKVIGNDQLLKEEGEANYFFPDVQIHCKGSRRDLTIPEALLDPVAVFEVLSPSTEVEDRTRKFASYSRMPALRHFVLLHQNEAVVEHFFREGPGETWRVHHLYQAEDEVVLEGLNCRMRIDSVYEGIADLGT